MRMRSPIPKKHARIEIIPLIDIMFFLLASFMMVSLSQTHMKGIAVNLPSNQPTKPQDPKDKDYVAIRVTEGNLIYFDNVPVMSDEVQGKLLKLHEQNKDVKVSLSAETLATHGDVISVLDKIRQAEITKIGYQIKPAGVTGSTGNVPPPAPGAPPPPPPKP
jgi:biopolymer transport protein ExbD